ncbi:MAG: DUF1838 domain-containing protein [Microcoleaceae cyanobacterium]
MGFAEELFEPKDWVRVRANTDGQSSFLIWRGTIYGVVPGEPKQRLFKMLGMSVARCQPESGNAWKLMSREISYYLDPKTESPIHAWHNPWTKETVTVVHVANNRVQRALNFNFPGIVTPELTTFVVDLFANYPNPLAQENRFQPYSPQPFYQATELFKFIVPTEELKNSQTSTIQLMQLTWDRGGPWLPWMKMGNHPGYLIYSAWGQKVDQFEDLPPLLKSEIQFHLTLYKNAPNFDPDQPDMPSWLYFQQHFEAYLNQARFPQPEQ